MSIEAGLFNLLKTITAIGTRIYPSVMPQNPIYPNVVYQRISSFDAGTIGGTESLDMGRFQIKIYSPNFADTVSVLSSIKSVMSGKSNKLMQMMDYESDTKLHVQIIDFQLSDDIVNG